MKTWIGRDCKITDWKAIVAAHMELVKMGWVPGRLLDALED